MAEIKKRITQLGPASGPLDGTEVSAVVQGGVTKKIAESTKYGAGWWDKLKAGFVDFIAPEALHANDADTVGGETSAELHNAAALTGTAPLSVIPAELTGKNAATATLAASCSGNAATATLATATANIYGSGLPPANATQHGRFFYSTLASFLGLWYCTRTASDTYGWIKIN